MNATQFGGIVRAFLAAGAGYLIGKGLIDQGTADQIVGALVTISVAGWSFYTNRKPT